MSKERLIARWNNLSQPNLSELTCIICEYNDKIENFEKYYASDIFYAGEIIRYKCPTCDVIFGDLRFLNMDKNEISNDYMDVYSFFNEGDTSGYILHVINTINLGKDKIYLDYACGKSCKTLDLLKQNEYNIWGYDAFVAMEHPNFMNSIDDNMKFDVIYSNNYIEHLIDPYEDLSKLIQLLNDGGKLVMISACWEYVYEYTHYHTFFFLGRSINYLCDKLNIKLVYDEKIMFNAKEFTIVKIFEKR